IIKPDDRRAHLQRHVLDLHDLAGMGFGKRAAEDGEILGEDEDLAPIHRAPSGHHAVARHLGLLHAEIGTAMLDEHVEFLEALRIEEELDAFACRQLAALMLGEDAPLAAAEARLGTACLKFVENGFHRFSAPHMSFLPLVPYSMNEETGNDFCHEMG